MNENPKTTGRRSQAGRMRLFDLIIECWKESERRRFDSQPPERDGAFEDLWPLRLTNKLLDATIQVSRAIRARLDGHENG